MMAIAKHSTSIHVVATLPDPPLISVEFEAEGKSVAVLKTPEMAEQFAHDLLRAAAGARGKKP